MHVRERSREILRAQLAESAADFCAAHGFRGVTAEEIARGIGVSRATFFRYFSSKEDAIVTAATTTKQSLQLALQAHPPAPGTAVFDALRRALDPTVELVRSRPEQTRARIRMIAEDAGLRAHLGSHRAQQSASLAEALGAHLADPAEARAVAVAATAAIELGWTLWEGEPLLDLGTAFDRAFALIATTASLPATK